MGRARSHDARGRFSRASRWRSRASVGGVSGAIWGTAFLRASVVAGTRPDLTSEDVIAMLTAAAEGMKKRGQSDVGDKTLLDAYMPAIDEFARIDPGRRPDDRRPARGERDGPPEDRRNQAVGCQAGTRVVHRRAQLRHLRCGIDCRGDDGGAAGRSLETVFDRCREGRLMKKFVNDPKQFVPEMLKGIALANPGTIKYVPEFNLIMRADAPDPNKVSIVQEQYVRVQQAQQQKKPPSPRIAPG